MKITLLLLALMAGNSLIAQRIRYEMSFPNALHHEAEISVSAYSLAPGQATFRMSRASPGRYATHEFGKNIYNVRAYDRSGKPVTINRLEGDVYSIPQQDGFVRVTYTLYANAPDGTYAGIDAESIHLNMPACFLYLKNGEKFPIELQFNLPEGKNWKVATQLVPGKLPNVFTAPNLQYFMDSPTKIGDLQFREWETAGVKGNIKFRVAVEADSAGLGKIDSLTAYVRRIVDVTKNVFGEFPAFDYGTYTFIASFNPWVNGDGMEHRNSTMLSYPGSITLEPSEQEGFSHEFFHAWNVERIRPQTLEPFNFERSNMSNELWFAEGFTHYYGGLLLARADIQSDSAYLSSLANLVNTKANTIGGRYYSPVEASRHAVFVDAGVAVDRTNYPNFFISYYPYGAAIALALDLGLRGRFNKSLDDYMQIVWRKYGRTENPFNLEDLQRSLGDLTNDKAYAKDFFTKYIYGSDSIDFNALLEPAGLELRRAAGGKAWAGNLRFHEKDGSVIVASNTIRETPYYEAGLDIDDTILELNGKAIRKGTDIKEILEAHKPGDVLPLVYKHRDKLRNAVLRVRENPRLELVRFEDTGKPLGDAQKKFRAAWLHRE